MSKEHFDYVLAGSLMGGSLALPSITQLNEWLAFVGFFLGALLGVLRLYQAIRGQGWKWGGKKDEFGN
jgi:hypothetical protein